MCDKFEAQCLQQSSILEQGNVWLYCLIDIVSGFHAWPTANILFGSVSFHGAHNKFYPAKNGCHVPCGPVKLSIKA